MVDVSAAKGVATDVCDGWDSWENLLRHQACSRRIKEQFTGEVGAKSKELERIGSSPRLAKKLEVSQSDIFHALDAQNEAIKQQVLQQAGLPTTPSKAVASNPTHPAREHDSRETSVPMDTQQRQPQLSPSHTHSHPFHPLKSLSLKLSAAAKTTCEPPLVSVPTQLHSPPHQAADAQQMGWVSSSTSQGDSLSKSSSSSVNANEGDQASRPSEEGEVLGDQGLARKIIVDSSIERHHEPPYTIHRMWNPVTNKIQATAKPGDFHIGPQEIHRRELESLRCSSHHADHARHLLATKAAAVTLSKEQHALANTNPYFNTPYHTHPRCLSVNSTNRSPTPCGPYMPQWLTPPGFATTTSFARRSSWSTQGTRPGSAASHSFRSTATAPSRASNPTAAHRSKRPFSAPAMQAAHVYSSIPPRSAPPPLSPSQHNLNSLRSSAPLHTQQSHHNQPFHPSGPPSLRTSASTKPATPTLSQASALLLSHTLSSPHSTDPTLSSLPHPSSSAQAHHQPYARPVSAQPSRQPRSPNSFGLQAQLSSHQPYPAQAHPAVGWCDGKGWGVDQQPKQQLLLQVPSLGRGSPSLAVAISPIKEDSQEEELQVFNEAADSQPPELTFNPLAALSQTQASAAPHRIPHPSASGDEPDGDGTAGKEWGPPSPQLSPTLSPTLTSRASSPNRYSLFPTPAPSPTVFGLRSYVFNTGHIFDNDGGDAQQDNSPRAFKGDQFLSPGSEAGQSFPSQSDSLEAHMPSHLPRSLSHAPAAPNPANSLQGSGSRPQSARISTAARSHSFRTLQSPQTTARGSSSAAAAAPSAGAVSTAVARAPPAIVVPAVSSRPPSPALLAYNFHQHRPSSSSIHEAEHTTKVGSALSDRLTAAHAGPPSPLPLPPHLARPLSAILLQRHYEQQQQLRSSRQHSPHKQQWQQQQHQQQHQQARATLEVASPTHSSSPLPSPQYHQHQHQQHQLQHRASTTPHQLPHTHSAGPTVAKTSAIPTQEPNNSAVVVPTATPTASSLRPLGKQTPPSPSSAILQPPAHSLSHSLGAGGAPSRPASAPRFSPTPSGAQPFQPRLRSVQRRPSASFGRPHSAMPFTNTRPLFSISTHTPPPTHSLMTTHSHSTPTAAAAAAARHSRSEEQQQQQQRGGGGEGTERMCTWQEVGGALEEGSALRTRSSSAVPQSKGVSWQAHPTVLATPVLSARRETAGVDAGGNGPSHQASNKSGANEGGGAGAAGSGRGAVPQPPNPAPAAGASTVNGAVTIGSGAGMIGSGARPTHGSAARRAQSAMVPMSARGRAAVQAEQAAKRARKEAEELSMICITMPSGSAVDGDSEETCQRAPPETVQTKAVDMTTAVQGAVAASQIR